MVQEYKCGGCSGGCGAYETGRPGEGVGDFYEFKRQGEAGEGLYRRAEY